VSGTVSPSVPSAKASQEGIEASPGGSSELATACYRKMLKVDPRLPKQGRCCDYWRRRQVQPKSQSSRSAPARRKQSMAAESYPPQGMICGGMFSPRCRRDGAERLDDSWAGPAFASNNRNICLASEDVGSTFMHLAVSTPWQLQMTLLVMLQSLPEKLCRRY